MGDASKKADPIFCLLMCMCVCVCVCVRESKREGRIQKSYDPYFVCHCMRVSVYMYVCVCLCVREGERERDASKKAMTHIFLITVGVFMCGVCV